MSGILAVGDEKVVLDGLFDFASVGNSTFFGEFLFRGRFLWITPIKIYLVVVNNAIMQSNISSVFKCI